MKKTFIIGVILLIVGGVLLSIGLGKGGLKSVYWDDGLHVDAKVSQSKNIKQVKKIKVTGGDFGPILIHRGNQAKVTVRSSKSARISTTVSGDELTISGHSASGLLLGELDYSGSQPVVEVTVPKRTQLQNVSVDGLTDTRLEDLALKDVTMGDGDLRLTRVTVSDHLRSKANSYGDLTLQDTTIDKGFEADTAGDITVTDSQFKQKSNTVHSSDGDIYLRGNRWQSADITADDGDINLANETVATQMTARANDGGDINAGITPTKRTVIRANASDGDVMIYGKDQQQYGQTGQNNTVYQLSSTDGDVTVRK